MSFPKYLLGYTDPHYRHPDLHPRWRDNQIAVGLSTQYEASY